MQVDINPRGNGACPLCRQFQNCRIHKALNASIKDLTNREKNSAMELVIYSCPAFEEQA